MTISSGKPLIGVSACLKTLDGWAFHAAGEKYVTAVVLGAEAQPLLVPPLGAASDVATLIAGLDGIMLTGSPSNVEPVHYGGSPSRPGVLHDAARDHTILPLIRAALAGGVPLLAVCRGLQEVNVALGGSLHQHLQEVPGRQDHRRDPAAPREAQYAPRHRVTLLAGGLLQRLAGSDTAAVNSLHGQGIDRLAPGLVVEATAEDGTIEAVRAPDAAGWNLALQWHPEWKVLDDPLSAAIFADFGAAARQRAQRRTLHADSRTLA